MTIDYAKILTELEAIVREAAVLTQAHFARFRDIEIGIKGPGDFVSEADRASETLIRERLFAIAPDWSLTGEEFAPVEGTDAQHRWLVDPIDGTTNFLNGQHYTITIALRRGSETVCGVVYDPVADEMFTGLLGGGAFLNGARMRVSGRSGPAHTGPLPPPRRLCPARRDPRAHRGCPRAGQRGAQLCLGRLWTADRLLRGDRIRRHRCRHPHGGRGWRDRHGLVGPGTGDLRQDGRSDRRQSGLSRLPSAAPQECAPKRPLNLSKHEASQSGSTSATCFTLATTVYERATSPMRRPLRSFVLIAAKVRSPPIM
jgi:Inositol monophosphatase family